MNTNKNGGVKPHTAVTAKTLRNRRRRHRRAQRLRTCTGPNSGSKDTALRPIGGSKNLAYKTMEDHAMVKSDPFQALHPVLSEEAIRTLKFMISPSDDVDNLAGFPDGASERSLLMPFTQNISIEAPSGLAAGAKWDCVIIQYPSIDYPIQVFTVPSGSPVYTDDLGDTAKCRFYGIPTVTELVNITDGETAAGLHSTPYVSLTGVTGGIAGQGSPGQLLDLTRANVAITWASDVSNDINEFRILGHSLTTHLNASAVTNEGIVYSRQINMDEVSTLTNSIIGASGAVPASTDVKLEFMAARLNTIANKQLPRNVSEFTRFAHYTGNAADGCYTVGQYAGNSKMREAEASRVAVSNFLKVTGNNRLDLAFTPWARDYTYGNGQGTATIAAPVMMTYDQSWTPIVQYYVGLNEGAKIDLKSTIGAEVTATPEGSYSVLMRKALPVQGEFESLAKAFSNKLPPGAPASANDFWGTLKNIGSTVFEVLRMAAPLLLPVLGL